MVYVIYQDQQASNLLTCFNEIEQLFHERLKLRLSYD